MQERVYKTNVNLPIYGLNTAQSSAVSVCEVDFECAVFELMIVLCCSHQRVQTVTPVKRQVILRWGGEFDGDLEGNGICGEYRSVSVVIKGFFAHSHSLSTPLSLSLSLSDFKKEGIVIKYSERIGVIFKTEGKAWTEELAFKKKGKYVFPKRIFERRIYR